VGRWCEKGGLEGLGKEAYGKAEEGGGGWEEEGRMRGRAGGGEGREER